VAAAPGVRGDLECRPPIIRRYRVIGAFDGALTVLGIIIGVAAFGDLEAHRGPILSASVGAAFALGVSSAVGAYEAERVEKKIDLRSIERAMLARMSADHREAFRFAALLSAFVHGIAPLVAALLPVIPFAFLDAGTAVLAAIGITLTILFAPGAYLGNLVRKRILWTGLRFAAAGAATALVLWLLGAASCDPRTF
jgi:predicted membrane protein (TIGR00267 family)